MTPRSPQAPECADLLRSDHDMLMHLHEWAFRMSTAFGLGTVLLLLAFWNADSDLNVLLGILTLITVAAWAWFAGQMMLLDRMMRLIRYRAQS